MTSNQDYKGTITHFSGFRINSADEFGFCPEEYSKFKYGAENIARKFGYQLAERFIENCFSKTYDGIPLVVLPSAYSHIPTASFFMKKYFVDKLNNYLYSNGHPVVAETKIHRTVTYREDYGEMSAEDRYRLIKGDRFYIDKDFLEGKKLLFLDDIKITGTHERIIVNMLNGYEVTNDCYMLYFAELINKEIPANIENYLNNYYVRSVDEVADIIKNEKFCFNTRVVKFILNAEPEKFDNFIRSQCEDFVTELYYNAIGNEYFKFSSYLRNLEKLKEYLSI
ncbi:MAG: phosphoribosyltransferase family protein [Dysgonomonas sp.]|nr:phosphoribosyltransferase family protein [Dysgonomonas sp.]